LRYIEFETILAYIVDTHLDSIEGRIRDGLPETMT